MRTPFTKKRLVGGAVAAVVLVGAVAAASARSDSSPSYRTATASTQTVDQVLHAVATVEPVSQASVAFPVAGTVAKVDVKVGQSVTVGTTLASLDVESLQVIVHQKQAALDQANLTLQLALDGEDVGSISGGSNPSGGTFGRSASAAAASALQQAQQAVLDAQHAVDEATAAAQQAYDNATAVCSSDAVAAATADAADGDTTTTTAATGTDDTDACLAALQAVLDAQAQVTAAQQDLTDAVNALNALLDDMANSTTTTTTPTTPSIPNGGGTGSQGSSSSSGSTPTGSSNGSNGTNGSGSSGIAPSNGSSSGRSPSAEDLIAYQKQVDAAADELAVAEQAVDQARIVSPIDGTVASVGFAVGDEVTASSSTQTVVIVGEGGFEVTTSISVKDLPDVKVGQDASVTPDGSTTAIAGQVVRIGVSPDSDTSSYPVTIALTGDTSTMGNGSTASVVIVTEAADRALAVPTSAVTVDGDKSTVQRIVDGKATTTTVTTGAIGQTWTEITDGLSKGDTVVLADLSEPLPGSATDSSSNGSSGNGNRQFPGGGTFTGPPGGFSGGGARPGG